MVPVPGTDFRSRMRVYHKDEEGVLHSLQNFDLLDNILDSVSRGKTPRQPWFLSRGDRERMRQMGLQAGRQLDFVIEFPWDARSFVAIVAKSSDEQLRRRVHVPLKIRKMDSLEQVLVMGLDRVRKTPTLRKTLAAKGLQTCTVRENPYLGPGHAPYENFVESLLAITGVSTPGRENLFELFLESAADDADGTALTSVERLGVRTVFHGTNHAVMDAILKSGLDPALRRSDRGNDYFGIDYLTSVSYTRQKNVVPQTCLKLLVFIIIVAPADPVPSSGAVTVTSNKFELPLAEITLDGQL